MGTVSKKNGKGKRVGFDGQTCWVGVDVHKRSYAVALLAENGQRMEFSCLANPRKLLLQLVQMGITIKALCYESGPTGYGLAWTCQVAGIPVVVAAPSRIPRPVTKTGKTDRLDSMKLVEYLARDMLKSISIPSREEFGLREIERARQRLVKQRREVRQTIRSFLLRNDLEEPDTLDTWGLAALRSLQEMVLPPHLRISLDSYLEQHANILQALSKISKELCKAAITLGHEERIKNLRTIPGVGTIIAHTFVCEIFRPERFRRAEDICAYVGLAPITSHSGSGREQAWIRPGGQRYLRSILVESAWRLVNAEAVYRDFYYRIKNRTGLPQKAIIAVARKLLVLIWRIAIERRAYSPAAAE
jgi:transposase